MEKEKTKTEVEISYTSSKIDSIADLDELEAVKKQEVEEIVEYFDQIRTPLGKVLQKPIRIMEGKDKDIYTDIRLPENISNVSMTDLQDLYTKAINAYLTYGEWLSISRSIYVMRNSLFERRKHRAGINEGTNDHVRKSLSNIRAEPEYMMLAKIEMVKTWIETRYFTYQRLVESISQLITTKSVEASRQMKDYSNE